MRAGKAILPFPVNISQLAFEGRKGGGNAGDYGRADMTKDLTALDYDQSLARSSVNFTDFIYIRLLDRGLNGEDLTYKFLINPDNISVSRQVIDAESLTRSGLVTGIWGDLLDINVSGTTAGQYFAGVLTSAHSDYSASARNLMELVSVYENNGCWFEGEAQGNSAVAGDITRKQLGMQADVTLVFGNFVWSGCFTELALDETAENPYISKFTFGFMAWKERFKDESPWRNSIRNDHYYGHSYEIIRQRKNNPQPGLSNTQIAAAIPASSVFSKPPVVKADEVSQTFVPQFEEHLSGYVPFK